MGDAVSPVQRFLTYLYMVFVKLLIEFICKVVNIGRVREILSGNQMILDDFVSLERKLFTFKLRIFCKKFLIKLRTVPPGCEPVNDFFCSLFFVLHFLSGPGG